MGELRSSEAMRLAEEWADKAENMFDREAYDAATAAASIATAYANIVTSMATGGQLELALGNDPRRARHG